MTDESPSGIHEQVRDRIGGWLTGDGWRIKESTPQGATWGLQADDGSGPVILVGQPASKPDRIEIYGGITVAEGHKAKLAALETTERQELIWNLRFEVARLGLGFQGIREPLHKFGVLTMVYRDALTQDNFCHRVFRVKNAVLLCLWTIGRALEGPGAATDLAEEVVH